MRLGGVTVLALVVGACAGDTATDENAAATPAARDSATAGTSGTADQRADLEFVREQLAMGEHEIELGRLAAQKAAHPEVKRFGEMMVKDHQMAAQDLKQVLNEATTGTAGNEAARPDEPHAQRHREQLEDFRKLSGREFDEKYIDQMVEDHEKAVNDLKNKAENANHAGLKQWASKTLPKVQQHLERARTIQDTLEKSGK
jgi:putative membrane protein